MTTQMNLLPLTVKALTVSCSGKEISGGTKVGYIGHVPGGMIAVDYFGNREIIDPRSTVELSK